MSDSSDPMDCSLPGSSVHGIFQAKVLEWVAIAFSCQLHRFIKLGMNKENGHVNTAEEGRVGQIK